MSEDGVGESAVTEGPAQTDVGAQLRGVLEQGRRGRVWRRVGGLLALAAVPVAGYVAWASAARGQGSTERYVTVAAERGALRSTVSATGNLEALNAVEVGAEISGKILTVHADFNDQVTLGQLLVQLDPEQHEATVAEAKAKVRLANAGVADARATLTLRRSAARRDRALAERGLLSAAALEEALAQAQRAAAALESAYANASLAKASLESARARLEKSRIVSPIDGRVLSREVEPGQTVNAGMQTPVLFVIAEDLSRMRLSASVDEADVGGVQEGQRATFTVDAYPGRRFVSQVLSLRNLPRSDESVVSYETLLSVDNPELLLKPGMTASVEITTRLQEDVLLVPNTALRFRPASERTAGGRRGPPIGSPLLGARAPQPGRGKAGGGGGRGGGGATDGGRRPGGRRGPAGAGGAGGAGAARAERDPRAGAVWVLSGGRPERVKVIKVGTDGLRTAVEGPGLQEGVEVVTDLLVKEG